MAEDAAARTEHRPRLGRGLAALLGGANAAACRSSRAARDRRRSSSCGPIRATRESDSTTGNSTNSPPRSRSAESSSRSWFAPFPASRTLTKSSLASGAGGPRSGRGCTRSRSSSSRPATARRSRSPSSKMCSARISTRSRRPPATPSSAPTYGYSHGDIARVVGKSRSHVANTLRLTNLPEHTRALLAGGQISAGHARALLAVADPDALADRIVAEGLTVRDIERFGENSGKTTRPRKATATVDADTRALQDKLGLALGTKVTIRHSGESGDIRIAFRDFDQLDDFCRRLLEPAGRQGAS